MGQCLEKLPHSCGTHTGLQVFARDDDDTVDGWCFSCGEYVRHPYGDERREKDIPKPKEKTQAEKDAEVAEVAGYPTVDLPKRRLKASILEEFGVKIEMSTKDGKTPMARYYPYRINGVLSGYKVKLVAKKVMWSVGSLKGVDLFGWEEAIKTGAKKLIVTTGEDDAIALRRILQLETKEAYKDMMPAVVSLVHGDGSAKADFIRMKPKIKQYFKEVVLAFDMDASGQAAAEEVCKIMPEVQVAALPMKDANECLIKGAKKALYNAVTFNMKRKTNTSLVVASRELFMSVREPAKWGELSWPWEGLQDLTRGIRYGETYYLGAGVKMGKSEVLNALATHFVLKDKVKVFMAKPEESNAKTLKLMAGKAVGSVFHDPKVEFDYKEYDRAIDKLEDKFLMLDLYQHMGWESLQTHILEAIEWGAKAIFIDPITNLTNGMEASKANEKLQEVAQELAAIALDHKVAIFIFCHLKAPEGNINHDQRRKKYDDGETIGLGNCPHELGGNVISAQFAGSRGMMRSCNYMIGIEGNKDDILPWNVRNIRKIKILEDREFGEVGNVLLRWKKSTTLFEEL